METVELFEIYLSKAISTLVESVIYTNVNKMYTDREIDAKTRNEVINALHASIVRDCLDTAKQMSMNHSHAEKENELLQKQLNYEDERLAAMMEKLNDENQLLKKQLAKEDERLAAMMEKLNDENQLLKKQLAKEDERLAAMMEKFNTENQLLGEQKKSETAREQLLKTQKNGFLDNRVFQLMEHLASFTANIEEAGVSAPQPVWDSVLTAIKAMLSLAAEHPGVPAGTITLPLGEIKSPNAP